MEQGSATAGKKKTVTNPMLGPEASQEVAIEVGPAVEGGVGGHPGPTGRRVQRAKIIHPKAQCNELYKSVTVTESFPKKQREGRRYVRSVCPEPAQLRI